MSEFCMHQDAHTVDSRKREGYTYRRYQCDKCAAKFTTVEIRLDEGSARSLSGEKGKSVFDVLRGILVSPDDKQVFEQAAKVLSRYGA